MSLYQWSSLDFQKISVVTFISDFTSLKKYQLLVISGIKYYNILSVILKSVIIFLNFISFVFISDHIILKNISFHCYQWIPRFQNISVIGYQWCHFLELYQLCISVHWYKNGPLIKNKPLWQKQLWEKRAISYRREYYTCLYCIVWVRGQEITDFFDVLFSQTKNRLIRSDKNLAVYESDSGYISMKTKYPYL